MKVPKLQNRVISGAELMQMSFDAPKYIVEGLLPIGTKRPNIIAAPPGCGKTTVAHQGAVDVAKGIHHLGRPTKRSEVLLYQCENSLQQVQVSLRRLGYDAATDAPIHIYDFSEDKPGTRIKVLHEVLDALPNVGLVYIETFDDLMETDDIKENSDIRRSFDKFNEEFSEHMKRMCFVLLHHLRKKESDNIEDMMLGGIYLRSKLDTRIYLKTVSDSDPRRIILAKVRDGEGIEPTFTNFDTTTRRSTLGLTVAEERKKSAGATEERIRRDILDYFLANPDKGFEADCLPSISGHGATIRKVFNQLIKDGLLELTGEGKKGSPLLCRRKAIAVETARPTVIPDPVKVIPETKPQPPTPTPIVDFALAMRAEPNKEKRAALLAQYRAARQTSEVLQ